jgi:protein-L-isoaspartate(D-aspartate) O-methyltransferase
VPDPRFRPFDGERDEAAVARLGLLRQIAAYGTVSDGAVLSALGRVPRHEFVPPGTSIEAAYRDRPLPIGHEQTISQPYVVVLMTEALELSGVERVLEIGTGSGYQSAFLSLLARHVDSVETIPELYAGAQARLVQLGYVNVDVHLGDGYRGWPEGAPYDRVLLTAAPPAIPQALIDQLAVGGILVAPVGPAHLPTAAPAEEQRLVRWRKREREILREDLGAVRFVPMVRSS